MPQRADEALRDAENEMRELEHPEEGPQVIEDAPDDFGLEK